MEARFRYVLLAAVLLAAAFCAGCGGSGGEIRSSFVEFTPEQLAQIDANTSREYQIQAGDLVDVAFAHQSELNQDRLLVLPDGAINLVGVDRMEVSGLTLTQVDSMITKAYSREYISPQVTVIVRQSQGLGVYVLGEVEKPGLQRLPPGGLGVIGAITMAGGFTDDAAKAGAVLVRVTPEGYLVQEMDLNNFSTVEGISLAMLDLQSYDVIYVPRSRIGDFSYFSRSVLTGLVSMTRIAVDIKFLSTGTGLRF